MESDPDEVHLAVGAAHELTLEENATTGYRWSAAVAGAAVELLDSDFVPPAGDAAGAAGIRRVQVRAKAAGTAELHLRLGCSWSSDPAAERTVRLHVREQ
jgi:predicted secreted protein